jgi:phenylalanyl-tRNA synthetase beta subunit
MKYLHSWLQEHIDGTLPSKEEVARVLSTKSLEVEEVHEQGDNVVYDVKTLPHRAHDVMSHRGLARELATLFDLKRKNIVFPKVVVGSDMSVRVAVEDTVKCPRYSATYVEGVTVGPSPLWLHTKLEAIGQRSISNIVDITNFVMNDMGQPMHAFDAHKVIGGITVRTAVPGETMTTLDGKEVTLTGTETVIADDEGVLALAGVKGGTKALVDEKTTAIIFESANFNATLTRQTSDKHSIRTDSSKRYEQGITSDFAGEAMREALVLVKEICPQSSVGMTVDVYEKPEKEYIVGVSLEEINVLLGTTYTKEDIEHTFKRMGVGCNIVVPREVIGKKIDDVLGKPYKHGASVRHEAPSLFDCSSLTAWLYAHAGLAIPRVSVDQYVYTEKVAGPNYGDLVFSNSGEGNIHTKTVNYMPGTEVQEGVDHVGVYVGDGEVLHASRKTGTVSVEPISHSASFKHVVGYGRVTPYLTQERFVVTVPNERLDLRIKEDLIEEIGRIIGYDSIASVVPTLHKKGLPHKRLYYETIIKNILLQNGFSEIYTYTFGDEGEVRIVKGLASDKEKLRTNLGRGVLQALHMNLHNAPLLGIDTVKVFEFGNVFTEDTERRNFALAIDDGKKKTSFSEEVDLILSQIKRELKIDSLEYNTLSAKPYVIELDFDALIEELPEPKDTAQLLARTSTISYQSVSPYPFIVRDIAVWTPAGTTWEEIEALAKTINDPRIVRIDCFDTFTKTIEEKGEMTSYAFRFVIQSFEKTLTDVEANDIADKMYSLLKEKGYEIR